MFHVVLYQPEIPPNTGNIIRLCANTGSGLHLIHPLGFEFGDRRLRRAGLDYHEWVGVRQYPDWAEFIEQASVERLYACSTRGHTDYSKVRYKPGEMLLFGPETRGLPETLLTQFAPEQRLRIPMRPDNRSLNLSNAVAALVYEAWRQHDFAGGG